MKPNVEIGSKYDVVVVGARVAGAATAMLLARAGVRVLAVERGSPGEDALSTHALLRGGVLQLRRWGLLDAVVRTGTPPVRSATFHYGDEALRVAVAPRDGVEALYAPRRNVLDPLLVGGAEAAGAQVVHGTRIVDLARDARGRVVGAVVEGPDGVPVRVGARWVVGADGMRSPVAALAGAEVERRALHATSLVYGHWSGLPVDGYHWHYRPGVSAGAIPTNGGRTCLFVAVPPERFARELGGGLAGLYRRALAQAAPELAAALDRACLDGKLRPFPGAPGFLRRSFGPGWALVGDAGYYKDPLTAHGMTDALRDAELLARAIVQGTDEALARYQRLRDEVSLGFFEVTDRIASFAWDLDEARAAHRELARQMAAEGELLLGLDGSAPAGAAGAARLPAAARA